MHDACEDVAPRAPTDFTVCPFVNTCPFTILPHPRRALADWRAFPDVSEGKESDESPGVFATLIIQLPSNVEGGVFTVSDPSASPNIMPGGGAEGAVARDGSSIAFSGEEILRAT